VRADRYVARFGATLVSHSGRLLVIGGVARDVMLTADEEIVIVDAFKSDIEQERKLLNKVHFKGRFPPPLLIGSSVSCSGDNIIITGGGAVCFSFGTFWNRGCFTLSLQVMPRNENSEDNDSQSQVLETWKYLQTVESLPHGKSENNGSGPSNLNREKTLDLVIIQRMKISSACDFSTLVSLAKPVILEELNLGSCTTAWTSDYLQDHVGRDSKVCLDHRATHKNVANGIGYCPSSLS
jgi:tRNA wybutosine-synthesizing protein 4